jgi:glutathione S-transferase
VLHERTKENEIEVGFNLGFPMLEDGDLRVHETIAIMVYICAKYDQPALVGLTPQSIVLRRVARLACRKSS